VTLKIKSSTSGFSFSWRELPKGFFILGGEDMEIDAKQIIRAFMDSGGYIPVNKKMIKLIGILPTVLLGDLIGKYNYFCDRNELAENDDFFNTIENIENDTGLTSAYITFSFKMLSHFNLLEVSKKGMPARNYYKINFDNIAQLLSKKVISSDLAYKRQVTKRLRYLSPKRLADINNNKVNKNKDNKNTVSVETVRGIESPKVDSDSSKKNPSKLKERIDLNKKENTPKKRKILLSDYFPIENDDPIKIEFKELILWCNKTGFLTNQKIDKPTQSLYSAFLSFRSMRNGTFSIHASNINAWKFPLPKECLNGKIYSVEEIKEIIMKYGLQFQAGYWPFTQREKDNLAKTLDQILYSPFNKECPSPFLKVMIQPPKKVEEKKMEPKEKLIDENCFNRMLDAFEWDEISETRITLAEKESNLLASVTNLIIKEWEKQYYRFYPIQNVDRIMSANDLFDIVGDENNMEPFFITFKDWIQAYNIYATKENRSLIEIEMVKPGTKTWLRFIKYLRIQKHINFYPTDDEVAYAEKQIEERNKPKVPRATPVMPWNGGSIWEDEYDGLDQVGKIECKKFCKALTGTYQEQEKKIVNFFQEKLLKVI
jgi:hypothetical protein